LRIAIDFFSHPMVKNSRDGLWKTPLVEWVVKGLMTTGCAEMDKVKDLSIAPENFGGTQEAAKPDSIAPDKMTGGDEAFAQNKRFNRLEDYALSMGIVDDFGGVADVVKRIIALKRERCRGDDLPVR
jgi:hypothetical protein